MTPFQDKLLTKTDCDEAGDYVVPNVLSPRDLAFRPDIGNKLYHHHPIDFIICKTKQKFVIHTLVRLNTALFKILTTKILYKIMPKEMILHQMFVSVNHDQSMD